MTIALLLYQPAWYGVPVWDDSAHMTTTELSTLRGLWRIWFELDATQQYYPLTHSVFWLEHQLWGDSVLGHHLLNITLHAVSALLAWRVLEHLRVPGAMLAAALFLVHPVHVESVAWISELKNTLSASLYLGAMLLWLKSMDRHTILYRALAIVLFILALFSKTVTASLPCAILVIFWWRQGSLSLRRDVLPLSPMLVLGVMGGLLTAWVERRYIGATGAEFALTADQRVLIAGRSLWFYLSKLAWPRDLLFTYPRWVVSGSVWWQWLFPAGALALTAVLVWTATARGRRGPLAAWLFFSGTLFPALGFFNIYPFRFSFVADHFQYLASLGPVTLLAAGVTLAMRRVGKIASVPAVVPAGGALLTVLSILTWSQAGLYKDGATLYAATLAVNESCFHSQNILGAELAKAGKWDEAEKHFRRSLELRPINAEAQFNLGLAYARRGERVEALACLDRAIEQDPALTAAMNQKGVTLLELGRQEEATVCFERAVATRPGFAEARVNLANALARQGRLIEAEAHLRQALSQQPSLGDARVNLGLTLALQGKLEEATRELRLAVTLSPDRPEAWLNLGMILAQQGKREEAVESYERLLKLKPAHVQAMNNLAVVRASMGQKEAAVKLLQDAVTIKPDYADAMLNLGLLESQLGRWSEAEATLTRAVALLPNHAGARAKLAEAQARARASVTAPSGAVK